MSGPLPGDDFDAIDPRRTVGLADVGAPEHLAATAVSADGATHLVLARIDRLNDHDATYSHDCPNAAHEQLGPLPLEYVRRLAIARRRRR